jgi:ribonuclease T1
VTEQNTSASGIPVWVWGILAGLVLFAGGYWLGVSGGEDVGDVGGGTFQTETTTVASQPPESTVTTSAEATSTSDQANSVDVLPPAQYSDLPPVLVTELPVEAIDTLELIATGGPYPFDRDGLTFQNREGILPDFDRGHYREFTVITPGESTRGARRIVSGADGELYYTADHYNSFREIVIED